MCVKTDDRKMKSKLWSGKGKRYAEAAPPHERCKHYCQVGVMERNCGCFRVIARWHHATASG